MVLRGAGVEAVTEPLNHAKSGGLIPNPAAETAKVVLSPSMSRVEVFSMAGRRMYDKAVAGEGLSVKIDVSRWPTGTYIVRIHTPLGIATKRLIVRR